MNFLNIFGIIMTIIGLTYLSITFYEHVISKKEIHKAIKTIQNISLVIMYVFLSTNLIKHFI